MDLFSPRHLLLVLAIIIILFGGKKIPELARGLGQGIRLFKKETKEANEVTENHLRKDVE